jgi:hypothetical protein
VDRVLSEPEDSTAGIQGGASGDRTPTMASSAHSQTALSGFRTRRARFGGTPTDCDSRFRGFTHPSKGQRACGWPRGNTHETVGGSPASATGEQTLTDGGSSAPTQTRLLKTHRKQRAEPPLTTLTFSITNNLTGEPCQRRGERARRRALFPRLDIKPQRRAQSLQSLERRDDVGRRLGPQPPKGPRPRTAILSRRPDLGERRRVMGFER